MVTSMNMELLENFEEYNNLQTVIAHLFDV